MDKPTVRKSDLGPWIDTPVTQPLTRTTDNQHGPLFDLSSVGVTIDDG